MDDSRARDQGRERMRFLYQRFRSIDGETGEKLTVRLKGAPVDLRTSGLAVVAAQLAASTNTEDRIIADFLAEWLLENSPVFSGREGGQDTNSTIKTLLQHCVQAGRLEYEAAQQEALRLTEQAKLLAAALWPNKG